jgi:hypothetical protein
MPAAGEPGPFTRAGWRPAVILALVVVAGAALRIHALDSGLWYDEIVTLLDSVRAPLSTIVTHYPSNNDHPFYSVLARLAIVVLGEHPWTLRLPALVFGVAALPALYALGAAVGSRFEALSATLLLAVSYHHVWFSQNGRGYTILLLCAVLGTHLLIVGLRDDRRRAYVGYGVVSALGAYTHLTMVIAVLAQAGVVAAYLAARHRGRLRVRHLLHPALGFGLAGLLTLLLYAPFLLEVRQFFGQPPVGAQVATPGWAIWETIRGLRLGYAMTGGVLAGGALFLVGCGSYLRHQPTVLALFLLPGATLFAVTLLLQRPTFPRFFFFLAGFGLLIVVRGVLVVVDGIGRRLPGPALGRALPAVAITSGVIVSLLALPAAFRYPKQDYEGALRYVEAQAGPGGTIALAGGGTTLPYQRYYERPWRRLAGAEDLASLRARHGDVWLLHTFRRYLEALEPDLAREIRTHCAAVKTFPGTVADGAIVVSRCR